MSDDAEIKALIERWATAVHDRVGRGQLGRRGGLRVCPAALRQERGRWIVAHEHHSFPSA